MCQRRPCLLTQPVMNVITIRTVSRTGKKQWKRGRIRLRGIHPGKRRKIVESWGYWPDKEIEGKMLGQ